MSCRQEIENLVKKAEDAIFAGNSDDQFRKPIHTTVSNCTEIGDPRSKSDLVRKIDDHLNKLRLHAAEPRVQSLDELMSRPVPPQVPIKDGRRP